MITYEAGDLVACYLSNTETYRELLVWGIVLEVSSALKDVLVLDNHGHRNWYPSRRWVKLKQEKEKFALDRPGILAYNKYSQ